MPVNVDQPVPEIAGQLVARIDALISEWRELMNVPEDANVEWSASINNSHMTVSFRAPHAL